MAPYPTGSVAVAETGDQVRPPSAVRRTRVPAAQPSVASAKQAAPTALAMAVVHLRPPSVV
jgi:hypothetical protein